MLNRLIVTLVLVKVSAAAARFLSSAAYAAALVDMQRVGIPITCPPDPGPVPGFSPEAHARAEAERRAGDDPEEF